ncbi:unnamed protein product [Rotaria magnacalcarata]|uniref:Laccase n=2 Tax=Rotaria magnacalcarata TaxID=392030 RepID=A0A816VQQ3_9BILA|nr:unnamed protein product [Rotaria magnacalcarata]
MWSCLLLFGIFLPYTAQGLESFDPWSSDNKICQPSMKTCSFELHSDSAMTMFYKQLYRVVATEDGILQKYDEPDDKFEPEQIITADGYPKLVYVFNQTLPGPVLHVYQDQKISVRIFNDFSTESLSVHFHGIRQVGTPGSDGVGRVTQLSILPGSSFLHEFTAFDEGTYWYHSHVKSQTSMGLVGAFIVHPKTKPQQTYKEFTVVLQDWQHFYTGEQHQMLVQSGQFYPNDLESLTSSGTIDYYQAVDNSRAAEALVTSILVNGRGQYLDSRNNENSTNSPLERLIVQESDSQYRIRLINGGSTFSLVFSIDEHQLQVIASDGVPFAQPVIADHLIIGLGERYDVLVNITTKSNQSSWWIRVKTMDKNNNRRWHARAILQVGNNPQTRPTTLARTCSPQKPCYTLNCPFTQYGSDPNTICLTMHNMTTDPAHVDQELIADSTKVTIKHLLSLTVVGPTEHESGYEAINYLNMAFPRSDQPILNNPKLAREQLPCSDYILEGSEIKRQKCYHNIVAEYNDIVEFFIVNFDSDQHPIHLHGSFFHVLDQGFALLNKTTGLFLANNPDVECDEDDMKCVCNNCKTTTRLVKDTTIVPSGGYLRIRFRANNPGLWMLHCHTEPHLDRGMALMIHVAEDRLVPAPHSTGSQTKIHNQLWLFLSTLLLLAVLRQHI